MVTAKGTGFGVKRSRPGGQPTMAPNATLSPLPVFLHSFIGTQPRSFVYVLSMAVFILQWQSCHERDRGPSNPKLFTIIPCT